MDEPAAAPARQPGLIALEASVLEFVDSLQASESQNEQLLTVLTQHEIVDMETMNLMNDDDWSQLGLKLGLRKKILNRLSGRSV